MRFSAPFRKAQSDAHSELTPNFAAQAAANLLYHPNPCKKAMSTDMTFH
ncbi:hypothetical protein [Lapidilactobacillus salsurivasis]